MAAANNSIEIETGSDGQNPSLPAELRILAQEARSYAEAELNFRKESAARAGRAAKSIGIWVAVALAVLFFAGLALIIGSLIALSPLLGPWLAMLAVVGSLVLIILLIALFVKVQIGRFKTGLKAGIGVRDAAKERLDRHFAALRPKMNVRTIGESVADRVTEDARKLYDETLEIASESKGIIAGTIAALALWLLRHPILAVFDRYLAPSDGEAEQEVQADLS